MAVTVGNGVMAGPFTPNGVTTSFAFEFRALAKGDLTVYRGAPDDWDVVDPSLYDVAINAVEGGAVQFTAAPAAGDPLYIVATPMFDQGTQYPGGEAPFTPKSLNAELDRAAMRAAVVKERADRAFVAPRGEDPLPVELPDEGEVWGNVGGKMVGVPNGAAGFAQAVVDANEVIDGKVGQVAEDAQTVATLAGQVATNAGTVATKRDEAVQAATDAAGALALAEALMVGNNLFSASTIAAAITAGIAGVADGETFAASGDDVTHWELRRRNGSGSDLLWKMPKAILPGGALPTMTYDRVLTIADAAVTSAGPLPILTSFDVPAGMWGTVTVPSNSEDPIAIGTVFCFLHMNANPVRFLSDAVGDAVITPVVPGMTALVDQGSRAWLVKKATDEWLLFGELSAPPASAYSVKVFLDAAAAHTRKQERTGAAATTPAGDGDVTGSWRNLGTHGGYAMARTDVRRPLTEEQADGRVAIVTDGNATAANADFLELTGIPVDFAKLNLFVAFKASGYQFGDGIISLAPDGQSGDAANDRFAISHIALNNSQPTDFAFNMGVTPNRLSVGVQGMHPTLPHVVEWRKTANDVPATINIDGFEITHTGAQGLPALANTTALIEATVTLRIGANPGDNGGQNGAIQHSNTAYYCVVLDDGEPLTLAQRQAIRMYAEVRSRDPNPEYPAWADLTEMEAARDVLIEEVFGEDGFPTDVATKTVDTTPPVTGLTGLAAVYKLTIPGEADTNIKPRLWVPTVIRTPAAVAHVWAGHSAGWNANGIRDHALQRYLTAGVPVITHVLPDGPNDFTSGTPTNHAVNLTAYVKWARQAAVGTNTLLDDYPGAEVHMEGISGGGWATMLCAALDPRIAKSIIFVGSMYRKHYLNVDYEQHGVGLTGDELAFYVLGSADGRVQKDVKREDDAAGFNRAVYASRAPYAEGVAARAAELGDGDWEMIWEAGTLHTLTSASGDLSISILP